MLAELPAGAGVEQEHRVGGADLAAAAVVQAAATRARSPTCWTRHTQLGLVGRGAISTPGRALHRRRRVRRAIDAMARALPTPIDHFLVQADLTVVVPGPLERDLAEELATVATVESAGTAMVYRVSEQSIRHALDIGKTARRIAHAVRQAFQNTCAARA